MLAATTKRFRSHHPFPPPPPPPPPTALPSFRLWSPAADCSSIEEEAEHDCNVTPLFEEAVESDATHIDVAPELSTAPYVLATTRSVIPLHYSAPTAEHAATTALMTSYAGEDQEDYLMAQDLLHLAYPSRVRLPAPSTGLKKRRCVLAVFGANDLRTRDHYALALAASKYHMLRLQGCGVPVVALLVIDFRQFAQPSLVAGFYRQSPMRATFLLDSVRSLRLELEREYGVPLLIRTGRPEEHVPRLALELGAMEVFMSAQCAPHEQEVQRRIAEALSRGVWISRHLCRSGHSDGNEAEEDLAVEVREHSRGTHPYHSEGWKENRQEHEALPFSSSFSLTSSLPLHVVWQSTLIHLHDLPRPVSAMRESERWYHDDVTVATVRPTAPYTSAVEKYLGWGRDKRNSQAPVWDTLLPSELEQTGREEAPPCRGRLPTLEELGYFTKRKGSGAWGRSDPRWFDVEEVIGSDSAHSLASAAFSGGSEAAAHRHLSKWLESGGMTSLLRVGRERRTNTKLYSPLLARISPFLSLGTLSPRQVYEALRSFTAAHMADGFVQQQFREGLLRLSRRDFCYWMGLRYGLRLFTPFGPRPEDADEAKTGEWRVDEKIIRKWCRGLTGFPLADAAARELLTTGFVAKEGREALVWLLSRGLGQDWRVASEWLERNALDHDPFVNAWCTLRAAELLPDDVGDPPRTLHYLAHHHDQSGIYVKKWLPVLSRVPPVYIHRPHVMTPRMQALHHVYLGRNYPYPIKLWDGAVEDLELDQGEGNRMVGGPLGVYYPSTASRKEFGFGEALRHGTAVLPPDEWSLSTPASAFVGQAWIKEAIVRQEEVGDMTAVLEGLSLSSEEEGDESKSQQLTLVTAARPKKQSALSTSSPLMS